MHFIIRFLCSDPSPLSPLVFTILPPAAGLIIPSDLLFSNGINQPIFNYSHGSGVMQINDKLKCEMDIGAQHSSQAPVSRTTSR